MLSLPLRSFFLSWSRFLARIRRLWRSCLAFLLTRGYPSPFDLRPLTDRERRLRVERFIDSVDTSAICALASKCNGDLPCSVRCWRKGSFNVCFILDFPDGSTRLVRLPIRPAVYDAWGKVLSEVYTMQYVRDHTDIPVPRIYAYGRGRLLRDASTLLPYIVLEYVEGLPLTKKMLRDAAPDRRRRFLEELVDTFAQLRRLEFPRGGSLMPSASAGIQARIRSLMFPRSEFCTPRLTTTPQNAPRIVGAFSLRKNEFQVDGYMVPRVTSTTARAFLEEQYNLLHCMWRMPVQELGRAEAEREEFALHALGLNEAQKTFGITDTADSSGDTFCLIHPDLRVDNIIVDEELRIRGIIDWEFSVTVPHHAFLPPTWATGHSSGSFDSKGHIAAEFMDVLLSRRHLSPSHDLLAREWDFGDDFRLPMGYILQDPSDLVLLFYKRIYPKLYDEPRDKVVPVFFQRSENKQLREVVERRLRASERYTQYLKDNNLFEGTEEPEWQELREWTKEAQKQLQELREWSKKTQDDIARLEKERAAFRGREKQA
ncbi:hypothetical protein VTK73DRAFT_6591 [Phialemonium thermophilum]|uniref:Aminoglycoside phosphotransferase domain-containing protein n=1 Tax=Phialemonium thermophilum TaxID=223376 RepID=A0ABR3WJ46_9PEZI